MEDDDHPPHCTCEHCFEKPWLIACAIQSLRALPPEEIRRFLKLLHQTARQQELQEVGV